MSKIAEQVAHYAFQGLGCQMTYESLEKSYLGIAWSMGCVSPPADWKAISAYYHYEEVVSLIFLAMEAELLAGYLSKLMTATEVELGIEVRESGLTPADVLRSMVQWSYAHAAHRAHVAGAMDNLAPDKTNSLFDARSPRYRSLVEAAVTDASAIQIKDFQFGLSREHPWTAFVCDISDNLCSTLNLENDGPSALILQLAIAQKRTAFYQTLGRL